MQTGEWELRSLYTNPVDIKGRLVRTAVWSVKHDTGSCFDKVTFQYFRHEWETTRSTQVTFNHFHLIVASQELYVERTGNIKFFCNLATDFLNAASCCKVDLLCREYQCSITGMNTCKLNMFRDGIFHHFTILSYCIKFYLFRVFEELRNNYRIFFWNLSSHLQEVLQLFIVIANIHCRTRKYVRRTNQHRITYLFNEAFHFFKTGELHPCRLVNAQLIEHSREFITVLGTIDRNRRSTQYRNRLTIKFHC